jgi:Flp pilus assembly protein TadG
MPILASLMLRFARDERGVFAVLFGLLAVVLIAMGGAVVDYVSLEQTRGRAQVALDAAALALQPDIYTTGVTDEDIRARAEALVIERIADNTVEASVDQIVIDREQGSIYLEGRFTIPTLFVKLVGVNNMSSRFSSEAVRGSLDLEISVALDLTGSMAGSRMTSLKSAVNSLIDSVIQDDQSINYSRMALVPYSQAVNAGPYAFDARGPIRNFRTASKIAWNNSTGFSSWPTITAATRANEAVFTSAGHGYQTGDYVYVHVPATVGTPWTDANDQIFRIIRLDNNTFNLTLNGTMVNTHPSRGYGNYPGGARFIRCLTATCSAVVTTVDNHLFADNEQVYVTNVGGFNLNSAANTTYRIRRLTANTFELRDTKLGLAAYDATWNGNGQFHCVYQNATEGCTYLEYTSSGNAKRVVPYSTCVTERSPNFDTDVPPSTTYVGRYYAPAGCLPNVVVPLTDDKTTLRSAVNAFGTSGNTAGHLGIIWSWYMLSPNFQSLWPTRPVAAYGEPNLLKAAVIMTDGEFNTIYSSGVVARDSPSAANDRINTNAPNGSSYVQAKAYCDGMKEAGIRVFTVGFGITAGSQAAQVLEYCATDASSAFLASNGAALTAAFQQIARNISELRLRQ